MNRKRHDCPSCQCQSEAPIYPVECPVCHVLYGPGRYPDTHPSHCDGKATEVLRRKGAVFAGPPRAA
jgi:hypothetical protein